MLRCVFVSATLDVLVSARNPFHTKQARQPLFLLFPILPMDTYQLVDCLARSLDGDVRIRKAAEEKLEAAQAAPGYGVALARIILAKELPDGTRHLAAVLLKQLIKAHWQDEPACVSEGDKAVIRDLSAQALADPSSKIRTAVGVGIARIATSDWPENWPELLEILTSAIKERKDPNLGVCVCVCEKNKKI